MRIRHGVDFICVHDTAGEMATVSGSEKAQKGPAEAFTRLRTDHEQFLETYESESSRHVDTVFRFGSFWGS